MIKGIESDQIMIFRKDKWALKRIDGRYDSL